MALLAGDMAVAAVLLKVTETEVQLPETCPWSALGCWASGPSFSGTLRFLCASSVPVDVAAPEDPVLGSRLFSSL